MNRLRKLCLLALALSALAGAARADNPAGKPTKADVSVVGSADLQKLISQFNKSRDSLLAEHEALMTQLKNATAEQKKAIIAKMEAQQKDVMEQQRALAKQIRDEMRKLRESTPTSGRR